MSEEVKTEQTEEQTTQAISYEQVSAEALSQYATQMQAMQKALTPPEGKKLLVMRAVCPIHGDITNACKFLSHTKYVRDPDGKVVTMVGSDIICLECASELWRKYVHEHFPKDEAGNTQVIKVSPVFGDKTEEDIKEEQTAKERAETKAYNEGKSTGSNQ